MSKEPKLVIDKQKYLTIAETEGLSRAITALHHDMEQLEQECFEGPGGFKPGMYEQMKDFRDFSTELWKHRYQKEED